MKLFILGGGGREHALGWKLAQSPQVEELFFLPGNAGTAQLGENMALAPTEVEAVLDAAKEHKPDLVVVGPEAPLFSGITDRLSSAGFLVFGPNRSAALLEQDKAFAKRFMISHEVPTAEFEVFEEADKARKYVEKTDGPVVIKASGPALGKGVIVCENTQDASTAIDQIMVERKFGKAGGHVIVEECLEGEEVSVMILTDGEHYVSFPASQDHKPVGEGDRGPNTGGMGAYAPAPWVDSALNEIIEKKIIRPVLKGLRDEMIEYRGVLYIGLMITDNGPKVLEFNCRFGDPETQPLMLLTDEDILPLLVDTAEGKLTTRPVKVREGSSICVVAASGGYPGSYKKGKRIKLDIEESDDFRCFHAGTSEEQGRFVTSGGRVLGVTALAPTLADAQKKAYEPLLESRIYFENIYLRRDIGDKGISRLRSQDQD